MRAPFAWILGLVLLGLAGGCRNCDLVEAELRSQEAQMRDLREELERSQYYNDALQRELHEVRQNPSTAMTPEQASQTYTVKEIVLSRQTGGYDDDGTPGDEALQVVLEPRDPDGQAIKAPGSLHVVALDVSREGLKTPFSSWDISPDRLRRSWRSGLFTTGYYLVLPWKQWPTSSKVRVVVQFTLADGRLFEADKDVTVHLPPGVPGKASPAVPAIELPAPHPLDLKTPPPTSPREEQGPLLGAWIRPPAGRERAVESTSLRPSMSLAGAVQLLNPAASPQPGPR